MKVILMKNATTLKDDLDTVIIHYNDLRIEQTSFRTFILQERRMLFFWQQIAWIDIHEGYETLRISKYYWNRYEEIVTELAEKIEKHFHQDPPVIDIEVYYTKLAERTY